MDKETKETQLPEITPQAFMNAFNGEDVVITPPEEKEEVEETPEEETEEVSEVEETETEEVEEGERAEDEAIEQDSVRDIFLKATGYDLGEDVDDSVEGFVKAAEIISEQMVQERLDNFFSSNEEIKKFTDYVISGGDPAKYIKTISPEVDYSEVDITSESNQKMIITAQLKDQGFEKEEIEEYIKTYEDSNTLEKQAKLGQKYLSNQQKKAKESLLAEQKKIQEENKAKAAQAWQQVESTLDKETIAGLPIPKKEKDKFKEFLGSQTKDGKPLKVEKYNSMTLEEKLFLDFIVYKGVGSIKDLVNTMATTKHTNSLKGIINRGKSNGSSGATLKTPPSTKKPTLTPEAFKQE